MKIKIVADLTRCLINFHGLLWKIELSWVTSFKENKNGRLGPVFRTGLVWLCQYYMTAVHQYTCIKAYRWHEKGMGQGKVEKNTFWRFMLSDRIEGSGVNSHTCYWWLCDSASKPSGKQYVDDFKLAFLIYNLVFFTSYPDIYGRQETPKWFKRQRLDRVKHSHNCGYFLLFPFDNRFCVNLCITALNNVM